MYLVIVLGLSNERILWEYSLEAPRRGASNEYSHNICLMENLKDYPRLISYTPAYRVLWFLFGGLKIIKLKKILFLRKILLLGLQ